MPKGDFTKTKEFIIPLRGVVRDGQLAALLDQSGQEIGMPVTAVESVTGRIRNSNDGPGLGVTSSAVGAFMAQLDAGLVPQTMTIVGDSTGNEVGVEWLPLLAQKLADAFRAYTVTHRLWIDANQAYGKPVTLQTGSSGRRYITCGASRGVQFSTPDSAALSVTGDQSALMLIGLDTFPPSAQIDVCGKNGASGNRGIYFSVGTDGKLKLQWTADGTNLITKTSTVAITANEDGSLPWIGYSLDVDNGASGNDVKFWTSADGETLTQLGSTVTTAGTTSVFDNTSAMIFGGREGQFWTPAGRLYAIRAYSDAAFTVPVADFDVGMIDSYTRTAQDCCGNTWTIPNTHVGTFVGSPELTVLNGSVPGQIIAYALDGTRQPKLTAKRSDLFFVSYGHNEGQSRFPSAFTADYKTLCDAMVSKWPNVGIVAVLQNPEMAPMGQNYIDLHAMRFSALRALAAANRYAVIDAFGAFAADPRGLPALINSDGVHPTPSAGSPLWYESAWAIFKVW